VRRDIEISLVESLVSYIDNMEPNSMIKAMLEFKSKALILGRRVGTLLQREIKEGGGPRWRSSKRNGKFRPRNMLRRKRPGRRKGRVTGGEEAARLVEG